MVWVWEQSKMLRFSQRNGSAVVIPIQLNNDKQSRGESPLTKTSGENQL